MLNGKIAAIIDDEAVIINVGSSQGVTPGMRFAAVYETPTINDPDNPREKLGVLTFEIAKLQAANVQEKMTFCTIIDPYINKTFEITIPGLQRTESKIDPNETKIGGPALKLKVGTVVREISAQSEQGRSAHKP
jgi:hypothetical protein